MYVFALPFVHWKVVVYCCTMPNHFFSPPSLSSTSPPSLSSTSLFPSPPIANPIGLAVAQLASSYIVTSTDRIPMMVRPPPLPACLPASLSLLTLSLSHSHSPSLPPSPLPLQLWIYTIPAGVAAVLTVIAYWWNKPPLPPAPTSEESSDPPRFFRGLWMVSTHTTEL